MSTGLTYVTIADYLPVSPPELSPAVQVFNSYDEGYTYSQYLGNFDQIKNTSIVVLWTSGPNQNGFWSGTPWSFTPLD